MPDYDWRDAKGQPWQRRFPNWINGRDAWDKAAETKAPKRIEPPTKPPTPPTPRLFISHQRADEQLALTVRSLAKAAGFEVWLDVLDPALLDLAGQPLSSDQYAVALASIIEIALLNSTHVIAIVTEASAASRWIPYEYGRVKDPQILSQAVAAYMVPGKKGSLAEYMHLGEICKTDVEVQAWLNRELSQFQLIQAIVKGVAQAFRS